MTTVMAGSDRYMLLRYGYAGEHQARNNLPHGRLSCSMWMDTTKSAPRTNRWLLAGYLTECIRRLPARRVKDGHSALVPTLAELGKENSAIANWASCLIGLFYRWLKQVRKTPKTDGKQAAVWSKDINDLLATRPRDGLHYDRTMRLDLYSWRLFETWRVAAHLDLGIMGQYSRKMGDMGRVAWSGVKNLLPQGRYSGEGHYDGRRIRPAHYPSVATPLAKELYKRHYRLPMLLWNVEVNHHDRWRSSDATALARAIVLDDAPERLPILGDALMDAGCEDEYVISYCRDKDAPSLNWLTAWLVAG